MFRKFNIFLLFLALLAGGLTADISPAQASSPEIYFFWAIGCPHCAREEVFLTGLEAKYPALTIHRLEVTQNPDNVKMLIAFGERFQTDVSGVPFTVVGNKYFSGYYNDEVTGSQIEAALVSLISSEPQEQAGTNQPEEVNQPENIDQNNSNQDIGDKALPDNLSLPVFGRVELASLSLPAITVVLGFLDGFNPCAMWTLLFLISLLLGMADKKRMWILGSTFIVASALVYFIFMAAWLNLILFLGFITIIRLIIGLVALLGGSFNIRKYIKDRNGGCEVTSDEKRRAVFDKLRNVTQQKKFWLAFLGIIALAFAVNLVELICSAGLPAVYTQILALNDLSWWQYYGYILLYIFFFMLDDLVVFFVAMTTLQLTGVSTKYSRWSSLIGGIIMIIIGLLLIFKHELLMFG